MNFEKYNENLSYSYVFGAFGTIELLTNKRKECLAVLVDPSFTSNEAYQKIVNLCKNSNIKIIVDNKILSKIKDKGNIFVIGVFKKYQSTLSNNKHIVLHNVNDVGVIGTIIRSMRGFNFENLVLVDCDVDLYHYHLIRSTMGAIFSCNVVKYDNLDNYINDYKDNSFYSIDKVSSNNKIVDSNNISLIFNYKKEHEIINKIEFNQDIPLENIVNIILFNLYN